MSSPHKVEDVSAIKEEDDGIEQSMSMSMSKNEGDNLMLTQRRLQRKKLKRYELDDESSEDEGDKHNPKPEMAKEEQDGSVGAEKGDMKQSESKERLSTIRSINATEVISEVANQCLNGELSLLQNYEKKGEMNEVFGSQSLLSQELTTFSQTSIRFPGSPQSQCRLKKEPNPSQDSELIGGENEVSSSDPSSSVATSKLTANDDSFSQSSFILHSLPPLSVPESQFISDTIPANAPLSQVSALSGYDMIIGAAQALAERDGENSPFHEKDETESNDMDIQMETASNASIPPILPPLKVEAVKSIGHDENENETKTISTNDPQDPLPTLSISNQKEGKDNLKSSLPPSPTQLPKLSSTTNSTTLSPTRKRTRPELKVDSPLESPQKMSRHTQSSPKSKDGTISADADANANASTSPSTTPAKPTAGTTTALPAASSSVGYIQTNGTTYTVRRTKAQRKKIEEETNYIAKRAAELVEQLRVNRKVEKQLLLSMALTRENPRSPPSLYPPKGTVILNGFYWGQFPPLEKVLRSYMEEYYELSIEKCQSRTQQAFNNKLVGLVQGEATAYGWTFDEGAFDEKKIRDRIRCFFKTHIQNAKKRLKTMVRNPLKRANAKALAAHLDLIEKCDLIEKINEDEADTEVEQARKDECGAMPSLPANNNSRSIYDSDAHDAAQVLALGFGRLSQDEHVMQC